MRKAFRHRLVVILSHCATTGGMALGQCDQCVVRRARCSALSIVEKVMKTRDEDYIFVPVTKADLERICLNQSPDDPNRKVFSKHEWASIRDWASDWPFQVQSDHDTRALLKDIAWTAWMGILEDPNQQFTQIRCSKCLEHEDDYWKLIYDIRIGHNSDVDEIYIKVSRRDMQMLYFDKFLNCQHLCENFWLDDLYISFARSFSDDQWRAFTTSLSRQQLLAGHSDSIHSYQYYRKFLFGLMASECGFPVQVLCPRKWPKASLLLCLQVRLGDSTDDLRRAFWTKIEEADQEIREKLGDGRKPHEIFYMPWGVDEFEDDESTQDETFLPVAELEEERPEVFFECPNRHFAGFLRDGDVERMLDNYPNLVTYSLLGPSELVDVNHGQTLNDPDVGMIFP
eukprot:Skav234243  [mRNA]  locus=scaffold1464:526618:527811:- [translate_table: standard]